MTITNDANDKLSEHNILPKEIAVMTDDPKFIVEMIEALNKKGFRDNAAFVKALAQVDEARKKFHHKGNPDLAK